jgi:hypothetical protein
MNMQMPVLYPPAAPIPQPPRRGMIYAAINAVQAELAKTGIGKNRRNPEQGYAFRGIDDMYNSVGPLLAAHRIVIVPHYSARESVERESKSGKAVFYITVTGTFDFVHVEDGSSVTAGPFYGEAMDFGDKATNKAQSQCMKYALMQTFTIPTEGDHDTENQSPEVVGKHAAEDAKTLAALKETAKDGFTKLNEAFKALPRDTRERIVDEMTDLIRDAKRVDAERKAAKAKPNGNGVDHHEDAEAARSAR